jgi:hypothetical protein
MASKVHIVSQGTGQRVGWLAVIHVVERCNDLPSEYKTNRYSRPVSKPHKTIIFSTKLKHHINMNWSFM